MTAEAEARLRFTTGNPEIIEILNIIEELRARIEKLEERVLWIETYAEGVR